MRTLGDIMTTPAHSIEGHETVQEAARRMRDHGVGILPVVRSERCVGVVTDRDLVVRALCWGRCHLEVEEVMSFSPLCLSADTAIEDGVRALEARRVGRIIIVDSERRPIGVVSAGAIAIACRGERMIADLATELSEAHAVTNGVPHPVDEIRQNRESLEGWGG